LFSGIFHPLNSSQLRNILNFYSVNEFKIPLCRSSTRWKWATLKYWEFIGEFMQISESGQRITFPYFWLKICKFYQWVLLYNFYLPITQFCIYTTRLEASTQSIFICARLFIFNYLLYCSKSPLILTSFFLYVVSILFEVLSNSKTPSLTYISVFFFKSSPLWLVGIQNLFLTAN
jgi:hypothetical protein